MSRRLIALAIAAAPSLVQADDAPAKYDPDDPQQALAPSLGLATGGNTTPGGLRLQGHYLYQVTQDDWFETTGSITLGGGDPACFLDRSNRYTCDHGLLDGKGVEIVGAIRHHFTEQAKGGFSPFTRAGVGLGLARFAEDGVTGITLALHAGAGLHITVAERFAIVVQAELVLGGGVFGHDLGLEPQLGSCVLVGTEFALE